MIKNKFICMVAMSGKNDSFECADFACMFLFSLFSYTHKKIDIIT